MTLTPIDPPEGYDRPYRFFRNEETGNCWKVQVELREVRPPMAAGLPADAAPAEFAVCVSVSPPGPDGKALREDGRVVVGDSATHTFKAAEMGAPGFSADERVMAMVVERIAAAEARQAGAPSIRALAATWPLAQPAPTVVEPVSVPQVDPIAALLPEARPVSPSVPTEAAP